MSKCKKVQTTENTQLLNISHVVKELKEQKKKKNGVTLFWNSSFAVLSRLVLKESKRPEKTLCAPKEKMWQRPDSDTLRLLVSKVTTHKTVARIFKAIQTLIVDISKENPVHTMHAHWALKHRKIKKKQCQCKAVASCTLSHRWFACIYLSWFT